MRTRLTLPMLISLATSFVLAMTLVAPVLARSLDDGSGAQRPRLPRGLVVHHGPVTVTLADATSDGHQLGDLRTTSVATTTSAGDPLGRLDATLTTTAIDVPAPGDEIRLSTLVFSFGSDGQDQLVVSGSAAYPGLASTIASGSTTTRPIVGGSGRFRGVNGDAVSEHLEDDTWVHWLRVEPTRSKPGRGLGHRRGFGPERGFGRGFGPGRGVGPAFRERVREGIREFRADVRARQAERREAREAVRAARAGADEMDSQSSAAAAGAAGEENGATTAQGRDVDIVRTDLGIAEPGSAPGQELGLWQYLVPAGSELAPHTHAGWQIAHIASGELEYAVLAGEGMIIRGDGSRETIGPGTYLLEAGDAVVENPELQHFGHNRTAAEVIILAATLYPQGAPLSIPLDPDADPNADRAADEADGEPAAEPAASPAA